MKHNGTMDHALGRTDRSRQKGLLLLTILLCLFFGGCAKKPVSRVMETTAYCGCSRCCSWERGSWAYLKLDFWNRYVSAGKGAGRDYTGKTASGAYPREPQEGFFRLIHCSGHG